jgi:hypothetical protein
MLVLNKKARRRKIGTSTVPLMTFGRLVLRLAPPSGTWDPWRRGRLDTGQKWPDPGTWHRTSLHVRAGLWIRIYFELLDPDPDPGGPK